MLLNNNIIRRAKVPIRTCEAYNGKQTTEGEFSLFKKKTLALYVETNILVMEIIYMNQVSYKIFHRIMKSSRF